jgi:hypothetical protein
VLWYAWKDEEVQAVLGPEVAPELGIITMEEALQLGLSDEEIAEGAQANLILLPGQRITFQGGESRVDFSELALEIEPMSMERTTEALHQRRMLEVFGVVLQAAQAMPMMPYVRWDDLLDKLGNAMNVPDLANLIDMEALAKAVPMAGQQSPQGPAGGKAPGGKQPPQLSLSAAQPQPSSTEGQKQGADAGANVGTV